MSAFQVGNAHIDILVHARHLIKYPRETIARMTDNDLGRMLVRENMRSLYARYEGRHGFADPTEDPKVQAEIESYKARHPGFDPTLAELAKCIACYEYQACEHEYWPDSIAHGYCHSLKEEILHRLPGWEEAPWGWGEEETAKRRGPGAKNPRPVRLV